MPEGMSSPFDAVDTILDTYKDRNFDAIIVDFHAEATSEKNTLKYYLDGKVSAIVGTHTHVQTADSEVSDLGMGYISDIGMTGPYDSIIGAKKDIILERFLSAMPQKFEPAKGKGQLCAVLLNIQKGKTQTIKNIFIKEK